MKSLMKSAVIAALVLGAAADGATAASLSPQERSVISGADYRIVTAAVEASASVPHGPLEDYAIHVYEDATSYTVVFLDPDRPDGLGSSSLKMFEFEVELNKHDLSPIKWHGIR
jgi:hypothetical protein